MAAWLEDTAEAFEEIGEIDLALDWAKQATDFDRGHQSLKAAGYWCKMLAEHRPAELVPALWRTIGSQFAIRDLDPRFMAQEMFEELICLAEVLKPSA